MRSAESPMQVTVASAAAVASQCALYTLYQHILDELAAPDTLPDVRMSSEVPTARSLAELQRLPAILALTRIFEHAGLENSIGYNVGTQEISLMLSLTRTDSVIDTNKGATAPLCMVRAMLGVMCLQDRIEGHHQNVLSTELTRGSKVSGHPKLCTRTLLANQCLLKFAKQTGVTIVQRSINEHNNTLRVVIEPSSKRITRMRDGLVLSDHGKHPFQYCAAYYEMSGFRSSAGVFARDIMQAQRIVVIQGILSSFWNSVAALRYYYPSGELRSKVTATLTALLDSGMHNQSAVFQPTRTWSIYMHGSRGVGKSSFVRAFSTALQLVLRRNFDPDVQVDIVKVSPAGIFSCAAVQCTVDSETFPLYP